MTERDVPRMALLGMVWIFVATAAGQDVATSAPATQSSGGNLGAARPETDAYKPDPWQAFEPGPVPAAGAAEQVSGLPVAPGKAGTNANTEPRPLLRGPGASNGTGRESASTQNGASWLRTSLALGGIVGLILLLAWGYRQVAAKGLRWTGRNRQPGLIEILSRTTLSPRHSLCMVRVGSRLVLLGMTPTAVRALDVVQDPELAARFAGEAARRRPDSRSAEFGQLLDHEAHEYEPERGDKTESIAAEPRRTGDVRAKLAQTLERLRAASGA